jgi:hypothetical protein
MLAKYAGGIGTAVTKIRAVGAPVNNSGTPHHQLASCYLYDVHDSLDHILEAAYEFGMLAKYAGGIGTAVTKIRAVGSPVKGINGKSGGLIPFLQVGCPAHPRPCQPADRRRIIEIAHQD